TEHYENWQADLELMAQLGVRAARYGIPWYRVNPASGAWDWRFADDSFGKMLDLGIDPIVDLVHYGTPGWLTESFHDPRFPAAMTEYVTRLAERFQGKIRWFTPLNEPRITAHYCGRLGWWPPHGSGWKGLVRILLAVCRAIVMTDQALSLVDPDI